MVGTAASMIESIKFVRIPGACDRGPRHDRYEIRWVDPAGGQHINHVYWCRHPLCAAASTLWLSPLRAPRVCLTSWIPHIPNAAAVAYLLATARVEDGCIVPEMQARVGICSQWEDLRAGNIYSPTGERKLFTQRYFGESGPGVYSAEIVDEDPLWQPEDGSSCVV